MSTGAIFLDRDGTINERNPQGYITEIMDYRFLPGALDALAFLAKNSERQIVICTNQACIGKNLATWQQVLDLHTWMWRQIVRAGGRLDGIYICPHTEEDNCACRKPKAGLLYQAAEALDIDLGRSVIIGDSVTDIRAGANAGVPMGYLLASGRQRHWSSSYFVVRSLFTAARAVVEGEKTYAKL